MASQEQGWNGQIVLDYETAFGTAPDPVAGQVIPYISHTLKVNEQLISDEAITGRRDARRQLTGSAKVEGDLVIPLDMALLPFILQAAFGQSSSPWSVTDTQPSIIIEDQLPKLTLYDLYDSCKVTKLDFSFERDTQMKVTMGIMGAGATKSGTPYDAAPTAMPTLVPILFQNFALSIGGSPFGECTKLDLSIDFGLQDDHYPISGGQYATDILEGRVQVTGTMTIILNTNGAAIWDDGIAGTERAVILTANPSDTLTITMKEVRFGRPTKDVPGPQGRMLEVPFAAYFDDASPDVSLIQFGIA